MSDLSSAGYLEPFLGAGVCFYLWHFYIFIFTPCWRSAPAETYGALWAILRVSERNRAAKVDKKNKIIYFLGKILTHFKGEIVYFAPL
jgi:hypothetical protein